MSDETPGTPETPETPTERAGSPAARPRPVNPSAAAARRARQMGARRPSPTPRPASDAAAPAATTDAAATAEPSDTRADAGTDTTTATPTRRRPSPTAAAAPAAKPASSVGKKARPRPRPTPAEEPADEPAATDDAGTPARSGRRLVGAGVALSVLLLAVGAVFLVLTLVAKPAISQEESDRAVSAAKSDVALVTSYGYQTIDSDAAKAAAVLTGQFKQQYLDSITTVVKPQLPTSQTVTTGQVDTAGLVSADSKGRQVVVLVYGQQSVTNKAQTTPRIDAFQIRVTMQLVDGTWLVSQLEQLGNNA